MISYVHLPKTKLAESVDCLFMNGADFFETRSLSMPLLNQELFFNLGDVFEVSDLNKSFHTGQMASWLTGIHTRPTVTYTSGKHLSIGILFKPWGMYQAFGINAKDIANNVVDPALLFGGSLRSFVEEKAATLSPGELLVALENHLLFYYKPKPVKSHIIQLVEKFDFSGLQKGKMRALAGQLKLSPKTFIETFNTTIGISPVKYYQLNTVRLTLEQMKTQPQKSLTEIALDCGFYDQAHFIRVFKSFCGISPKQYRKEILCEAKVNCVQF